MKDFSIDTANNSGLPQLDKHYWKEYKKEQTEEIPVFNANINATFIDLDGISVFKNN